MSSSSSKKDCPTPEELEALKQKKYDLTAILTVFKCDPNSDTSALVNYVEQFWDTLGKKKNVAEFKFQKTTLWYKILVERINKQLDKMTADDKVDTVHDILATIDLRNASVTVQPKKHEDMKEYAFGLVEGITKHRTIVLFSTTDIDFLQSLVVTYKNLEDQSILAKYQKQLDYFKRRNFDDLSKLDGTIEAARAAPQSVRAVPIADAFVAKELSSAKSFASTNDNVIGLAFIEEPFSFAEVTIRDADFASKEELDRQFDEWKQEGQKLVYDMRTIYYRYRDWLPARLTWGGDDEDAAKVAEPAKKKKTRVPRKKQTKEPSNDIVEPPRGRPMGEFEKGTHPQQSKLNDLYRTNIPIVDAADNYADEILRLSVLSYQLAFEGRALDDILINQSGVTPTGANVFVTVIKPRLASFQLDTARVLLPTEETVRLFDSYLQQILSLHDAENESVDDDSVIGVLTTDQKRVRTGYSAYLLDFFWHYHLVPFGAMGVLETKVREALKTQILGEVTAAGRNVFTIDDKNMLMGSNEEKFNRLTIFVEDLTRDYVRSGRMFVPPIGTPGSERVQFTNNFAIAHQYAQQTGRDDLPMRLAEIFDIMGAYSTLNYGQLTLNEYLYEKSGKKTTTFYYTLQNGLQPGPDVGSVAARGYVFKYIVMEEIRATTQHAQREDQDDDGEPDSSMHIDAKLRNPAKYAQFRFDC